MAYPEQCRATIVWHGGKPIFQEEAGLADDQGGGRTNEDEDMTYPIDYFIGGDWAPPPWSSKKICELVFMFLYRFVLNFSTLLPYLLFQIFGWMFTHFCDFDLFMCALWYV